MSINSFVLIFKQEREVVNVWYDKLTIFQVDAETLKNGHRKLLSWCKNVLRSVIEGQRKLQKCNLYFDMQHKQHHLNFDSFDSL